MKLGKTVSMEKRPSHQLVNLGLSSANHLQYIFMAQKNKHGKNGKV